MVLLLWDLYSILNEQNVTIREAWDGTQLRCTFRRTFTELMLQQWSELEVIAASITFSDEQDSDLEI